MEKNTPEYYMSIALKEAKKAADLDEVPVGAVIVHDGKIIAKAHNLKEKKQKANAHAEMLCIEKAEKKLGTWCLHECDLYVTLEPCLMCTGIIGLSRIRRLYYGTTDPKGGCVETLIHVKTIPHLNTYPKEVYSGILKEECAEILTSFFRKKRELMKLQKKIENKQ